MSQWNDKAYALFEEQQKQRGIDLGFAKKKLLDLKIETPSWGYGDSGTRFKVFRKVGVPRDPFEKLEDAAQVHQLTGACPTVAIHIPWDKVDDYSKLAEYATSLGLRIGAVNPNVFQDDDYMLGSVTNADVNIRRKATAHLLECVDVMKEVGSDILSLWFADGTNYPGQGHIRKRKQWLHEALTETYQALSPNMRMLIEYKFFEPGFYHTDLADWGMAFHAANQLGPQAQVLVDTGHHAQGTNVEHIVAYLLDEGKLGGFHFNSRKYADDDLIVGTVNPYELFLIFYQILDADRDERPIVRNTAGNIAFMIDQSHAIEPKIPAMLRSVMNIQTQYAKALMINHEAVLQAQAKNDVLAAEAAVREAYEVDVAPFLAAVREEQGLPIDPMKAFLESGYTEKIAVRGVGGSSW
ncbi:L-rhamnose isomerase [Alicyclobacillus cycloheptanicus]|uniref:L-rhamnose isomerase/sugar isomerase n=1 Tax=Alicyclobacillus cycloheptanicus TaxID=1457 RepID=A0ABT9XH77_9BACL|nr:L-rhamnose isomerase [Alicyclobacillus cycloheptanicus]MDQ0189091.1 L-rhamnose isomerase/sugar isomerase [Alicyclobacillus cycloheptanicus]WDM00225.1 L-rhamnose isomerase [Alicyclobacillus cycloheptanicus]